jgi:hypothetical protein
LTTICWITVGDGGGWSQTLESDKIKVITAVRKPMSVVQSLMSSDRMFFAISGAFV